ncbi:MAG TPA: UDP-N-acetylmuramyl-tripeptide synthetase [Candidatus Paceibacterota bacterium]|jgi:UDP-N-acetylmuramoyl-L-alanyl-D-glutamate--2,6-diaminopimelate ligase|nr:UDP-N-acetylmuramyl-tripeptide synthetase [Candidatus Paceibacterota bacterium]
MKRMVRSLVPAPLLSLYHFSLAIVGALIYGFPSSSLYIIGVTGTKGKTSTTEYINSIFEAAGKKTALLNSIRVKVGPDSRRNVLGRSMPGRFFIQRFLAQARAAGCEVVVLEMTSEGAKQHRHRGIALDTFVFTNLAPEHIESHGSYEAYANAKLELARQLIRSKKRPRTLIVNEDDEQAPRYLALPAERKIAFSLAKQIPWQASAQGGSFSFAGTTVTTSLPGEFSLRNALAAAEAASAAGIAPETIARGIAALSVIPGRAERVDEGQPFTVVVDYAHTPESLAALCDAYSAMRKICILGSAGGGRDTWKRPVMGKVAEEKCAVVILTTDDPYDDDPMQIIEEIAAGMKKRPEILPDRREAIRRALSLAQAGDAVLITGMGIDAPHIRGGTSAWSDASVAREELKRLSQAV